MMPFTYFRHQKKIKHVFRKKSTAFEDSQLNKFESKMDDLANEFSETSLQFHVCVNAKSYFQTLRKITLDKE